MNRWICVLMTAILITLSAAGLADNSVDEAAIDAFVHLWVSEADEEDVLDILFEENSWYVLVTRSADGEVYSIDFEKCFYDEAQKALICEGGALERIVIVEPEDWDKIDDEVVENQNELIADQFGAILTVDADGLLHWTGSGDVVNDHVYVNWDEQDDGRFVGEWECGDTRIEISLHHGEYEVNVDMNMTRGEIHRWQYTCTRDVNGALIGSGKKIIVVASDSGEMIETEIVDDCHVTFTLDGDTLIWNDARENAGQGMTFIREVQEDWEEE